MRKLLTILIVIYADVCIGQSNVQLSPKVVWVARSETTTDKNIVMYLRDGAQYNLKSDTTFGHFGETPAISVYSETWMYKSHCNCLFLLSSGTIKYIKKDGKYIGTWQTVPFIKNN